MALTTTVDSTLTTTRRDHYWLLWFGIGVANLFMIALVTVVIIQNKQRAFDQATAIAQNYSRTVEANFVGFIRRIDVTLLTVAAEVARQKANGGIREQELNAFLARQDAQIAEARGLRVVDVQGNIRYAVSGVNIRGANLSDRPYFIRVRPGGHFKFLHLWPGQIPPVGDDRTGVFYSLVEPFASRLAASLSR